MVGALKNKNERKNLTRALKQYGNRVEAEGEGRRDEMMAAISEAVERRGRMEREGSEIERKGRSANKEKGPRASNNQ